MADPQVNFFKSTLVGTYSDSDTSLTVATGDGALLPDPSTDGAFNLTIFEGLQVTGSTTFEIVRVTARSGDVLTVTRGQESTTPLTIGSATHSILMSATKKTFDDINDAIANVDLTTLTGVEELTFNSTGDEEFGLPAGTTAQRPSSPSAGYMRFNTDTTRVEVYDGSEFRQIDYFSRDVNLGVAQLSVTANDAVFLPPLEVEYLVIAGAGGGGGFTSGDHTGGGGGAGGYRSSVQGESSGGGASADSVFEADVSTSYTVTVGAGGAGASVNSGSSGSNSVFSTITSTGGGGGGGNDSAGKTGGSGGGGAGVKNITGGSGTTNQGYAGGGGVDGLFSPFSAGGGGGAGEAGYDYDDGSKPSYGGDGVSSSITGSAVTRGGGGGGADPLSTTDDYNGGAGGGGGWNEEQELASSGTANTGGGGGGNSSDLSSGGSGGSGVVILRYPSFYSITIGAGLTGSETTDGSEKYAEITAGTGSVSWSEA